MIDSSNSSGHYTNNILHSHLTGHCTLMICGSVCEGIIVSIEIPLYLFCALPFDNLRVLQ